MTRSDATASLWIGGRPATADALAGLQLNYGHLTTMQVRAGAVQGLAGHLARLRNANSELFGTALNTVRLRAELASTLAAAAVEDATLRVAVVSPDAAGVESGKAVATTLTVAVSPPRQAPATPWRVCSHVHARALPHLKHLATLPLLHARRRARMAGFDDALLVDETGCISEGALWNVGFIDAGGVVWPEAQALRGITEGLIQAGLRQVGVAQRRERVAVADCGRFDAVFACNSSGVWALAGVDGNAPAGEPLVPAWLQNALAIAPWEPLVRE